ncbi:S41 family peptidase [Thiohalophilus thiocyanatoxydans]|uniref:C-terminal peptidase prc n=1 Tax=Thiohalophilus thiocyanatoxydans TaxID=381308 RepID=A0A4R8IKT9_9GAMM|nr:S41 family peptidase [Thiohalophilus thiocyanatoxydans]TDY00988.1 C-terminal peptidase prc [Thiohalophilus thiocyanatoxydans]
MAKRGTEDAGLRRGALLVGGLLLVACTRTPTPPADTPAAESEPDSGLAEAALITADPQLGFATRLAEETLSRISRQHVTPVRLESLSAQFVEQLADELGAGPWREARPTLQETTLAGIVKTLHQHHPGRPILPAVEQALAGVVRQLDSDSIYFDRHQFALLRRPPQQSAGIGVLTASRDGRVVIGEVIRGGPAEQAGLKSGDLLLAIDGQSVAGQPQDVIRTRLHGPAGSTVALRVRFDRGDIRTLHLQRQALELPRVEGRWLDRGIAYVRLRTLSQTTLEEFNEIFLGLIHRQQAPRGLVLDLRNNRGGILDSAVQLTDMFLAGGTILTVRGRKESDSTRYVARPRSEILEQRLPLALLINGETAAGAESLAAALQDHRRAVILGQRSRGEGRLYPVFQLPGERGLKLATGQLYRPAERPIAGHGVVPDICFDDTRARLIPDADDAAATGQCDRTPGARDGEGDPVLEWAGDLLADKRLYRELREGRLATLPSP